MKRVHGASLPREFEPQEHGKSIQQENQNTVPNSI